jgi:hypothetical protein
MPAGERNRYDVFLSFRSEDTAGFAQALRDRLIAGFPGRVFLDSASIKVGQNIGSAIDAAVRSCGLLVAIIGRNWHVDRAGKKLFRRRDDWVGRELSAAIRFKRKILTVFVEGTPPPPKTDLPSHLRPILLLKAAHLHADSWDDSVAAFMKSVADALAVPAAPQAARVRLDSELPDHLRARFEPLPKPTGTAPYRLPLESVVAAATMQAIRRSGQMVVHLAGSSGGMRKPEPQQMVAREMRLQFETLRPEDRPAFFYNLGDLVFFNGEPENYYEQFYRPYDQYPAPIVAIPGNHDGALGGRPGESLDGFMRNFCAARPQLTDEARDASRYAMTQPNPYWTLETPLATFVGLYTNLPEGGMLDIDQRRWLVSEMKSAPADRPLILAMHHFVYSAPRSSAAPRSARSYLAQVLAGAEEESRRFPDAVFSAHAMNYQRFTRRVAGRHVPYIVAGAGGYPNLHPILQQKNRQPVRVPLNLADADVALQAYCDDRHGFVRLTLTRQFLRGEYFAVGGDGDARGGAERVDSFSLDLTRHLLSAWKA